MELLEIAKKRFSVRDYTDQKVEPEKSEQDFGGSTRCTYRRQICSRFT